MSSKSYIIRLTSWPGPDGYRGFRVRKPSPGHLLKIREATFLLPTKNGVSCVLKSRTTRTYWNGSCPEFRFKDDELEKFKKWLDPEVRKIDWPRNNPCYYEAKVTRKSKDDSKVEICICV